LRAGSQKELVGEGCKFIEDTLERPGGGMAKAVAALFSLVTPVCWSVPDAIGSGAFLLVPKPSFLNQERASGMLNSKHGWPLRILRGLYFRRK